MRFDSRCPFSLPASALFVCDGLITVTEPRHIFRYYMASFYKYACCSKFWIEYTDIGRKCRQKSTKICNSIVFECCLTHGFRRDRPAGIWCS
jgi:hypothetical protein